jgi:Icc-related predicted phosphoesterase
MINSESRAATGTAVPPTVIRIAAMADLHYGAARAGPIGSVLEDVARQADVLLLCGDLIDHGLPEEARGLGRELASTHLPVIAGLGNHEHEAGQTADVQAILSEAGVRVLDGDAVEIGGVGFAGVKGFGGGFGERALQPWGEPIIKRFVHEAVEESLKLEAALAGLRTEHRIALLHYSPVAATVAGEPLEIFPFMGSSRLEAPLDQYTLSAVFHGHAHRGQPEGRTAGGVPVYNVAWPLLRHLAPERPPFRLLELSVPPAGPAAAGRGASP